MKKILIANWKMNPATVRETVALAHASDRKGVVICPPFPFLSAVGNALRHAALGAQDAFFEDRGAFTGAVSPIQLKRLGVRYIIAGHSERRRVFGETDAMVAKKVAASVRAGLIPILCVGETKEERARGQTQKVVERQLKIGLSKLINSSTHELMNLIIAYEPVWAIGTGNADKPEDTVRMVRLIRSELGTPSVKVIYGGSVNAENAELFLRQKEIDGALVGGASLRKSEFRTIIRIAERL